MITALTNSIRVNEMDKQQNLKKAIKADPTNWLLEEDDPGVRYLALRDIVEADEDKITTARTKAHREGPIARILSEMNPEGYWVIPGSGYRPKFKSGVWSIMSLAQLGGSIEEDKRIGTACAYLLDHALAKGGQFYPNRRPTNIGDCLQGNLLVSLSDLGCKDSRLDVAYEWMARKVISEGLPSKINSDGLASAEGVSGPFYYLKFVTGTPFACRTNSNLPCAWAAANVMMAFSRLPVERRSGLIKRAVEVGVDFFFSGNPAKADFPGHRAGAPDRRWWLFSFPSLGTDILGIAEALTALGYGGDPRLANTLDLIRDKQDEKGRWPLDHNFFRTHKMWVNYGPEGEPNKWVTLRALRVLKRAELQKTK
jgi:hypothetical protein